jgi:hypothetical protein
MHSKSYQPFGILLAREIMMFNLKSNNMVNKLENNFTINGISGKEYSFTMYAFDEFDDLKDAFNAISAIYILTKRTWNGEKYGHTLIYCGETGNLSTRFDDHHAETCIKKRNANCISIMPVNGQTQRKQIETDILEGHTFPCNTQHQ